MPIYDYVCSSCGHRMEVVHGVHGHGPSTCPVCGGPMRKAFAPPAVVFKGSGWARKERGSAPARKSKAAGDGADGSGRGADGSTGSGGAGASDSPSGESAGSSAAPGASSASTGTSSSGSSGSSGGSAAG
ncbi:MAG TPA: FmdB family zinc ribbon protein [Candidatus Limnocylindrales bacterium]